MRTFFVLVIATLFILPAMGAPLSPAIFGISPVTGPTAGGVGSQLTTSIFTYQ